MNPGQITLHAFLDVHRAELIERCRTKVASRNAPRATPKEMEHGIPLFLGQLIDALRLAHAANSEFGPDESGSPTAEQTSGKFDLVASAAKHGGELLHHGFTVDQVVYDYGDLCQAVTEMAIENDAPVSANEFQTLNRCLDYAIAGAVTEFDRQRDHLMLQAGSRELSERLGFLAHELRNFVSTATLSFAAIKRGSVAVDGATAAVLERSLGGLRDLVDRAMADVRLATGAVVQLENIAVSSLLAEAQVAAGLSAKARGCEFSVTPVDPDLWVRIDEQLLHSALSNLLQNAFKFTHAHSAVTLSARASDARVLIEVEDRCGGLPAGMAASLFPSFEQHGDDRSGLGLGLSIARRAVEACGGMLRVRDMPGIGCVFTIDLPLASALA